MRDLENKSITVTGGGSGMGRATALLAASMGARVTVSDIAVENGEKVVAEIVDAGGSAQFIRTDVSNEDDVKALVDFAVKTYGRLDGAFNNAGLPNVGKLLHELSWDEMEKTYAVNVKGVFLCMKYQVPSLLQAGGGSIVNMASASSQVAFPMASDYISSKHAVMGLTRAAALDYADKGIRVNAILPGTIHTPMLDGLFESAPESKEFLESRIPYGRLGQSDEVAEAVVWMLSGRSSYVTAAGLSVDGGYTAT